MKREYTETYNEPKKIPFLYCIFRNQRVKLLQIDKLPNSPGSAKAGEE